MRYYFCAYRLGGQIGHFTMTTEDDDKPVCEIFDTAVEEASKQCKGQAAITAFNRID